MLTTFCVYFWCIEVYTKGGCLDILFLIRGRKFHRLPLLTVIQNYRNLILEAQLPQRNSASAAHVKARGTRPPSPLSLIWLHLCVWSNPKATTYARPYVKRAVRKAHFKMNRGFKVILVGAGRSPEWSVVVMCN